MTKNILREAPLGELHQQGEEQEKMHKQTEKLFQNLDDGEKLNRIMSVLRDRYVGIKNTAHSIDDLEWQNPDLPISELDGLIRNVLGKMPVHYLIEQDILYINDWKVFIQFRAEEEEQDLMKRRAKFRSGRPVNELIELYSTSYAEREKNIPQDWGSAFKSRQARLDFLIQKRRVSFYDFDDVLQSCCYEDGFGMLEWAATYIYQNREQYNEDCIEVFQTDPNAFAAASLAIFKTGWREKDVARAAEIVFDFREEISQELIDEFYSFARKNRMKTVIPMLEPFASGEVGGRANAVKVYQNDVEKFCDMNFAKYDFERAMKRCFLKKGAFNKSKVKYANGTEVSPFVLKCAILPYLEQYVTRPKIYTTYKNPYKGFLVMEKCDWVASHFDRTAFLTFLEKWFEETDEYRRPQFWLPLCRYGTDEHIKKLISMLEAVQKSPEDFDLRQSQIELCENAIMLSDTQEAVDYAERHEHLRDYAKARATTEYVIRDTMLSDFGFDEKGKKVYNLGNAVIEATITDDLRIALYDTATSEFIESLPQAGADAAKYDDCRADYLNLKKKVATFVKERSDTLFRYFISGRWIEASDWVKS